MVVAGKGEREGRGGRDLRQSGDLDRRRRGAGGNRDSLRNGQVVRAGDGGAGKGEGDCQRHAGGAVGGRTAYGEDAGGCRRRVGRRLDGDGAVENVRDSGAVCGGARRKGGEDGVEGVTFIYPGVETVQITLEDGHTYQYRQKDTIWLFLNLILYLNAGNKDVEKSEVTRKYEKRSKEEGSKETPKPKDYAYKDIKQYEVGYRLVIERRKQDKNSLKGSGGKGSKKSPHFRKGHWHHWWVGSGEKRHLELRWQEGILVNGGPSDNSLVSVHKVN